MEFKIIIALILMAIFAILVAGVFLLVSKKQVILGRILITFVLALFLLCSVLIISLWLSFLTVHAAFYSILLLIISVLVTASVCCMLCRVFTKKAVAGPLLGSIAAAIIVMAGFYTYQSYIDSIPTVGENEDLLSQYAPYAPDTKAVSLDEPATLNFESDYPRMDGATALFPIYSAFAKALYPKEFLTDIVNENGVATGLWENEYLRCTTTTGAYTSIVTGECDIIFVAAPSEQQLQFAVDSGVELVFTPIGKEAFVFYVNSHNPIEDIKVDQIQQIYSGNITSWSQLGVSGLGKIKAFQRPEGSGSQSALIRLMDGKELMQPIKKDEIATMGDIIEKTADYKNHKNSIGYSFRFYSTQMVENNQIKLLSINGVYPSIENIENGSYPIASDFYAVTRKDCTENTKKLLEWIGQKQGQKIISRTGYTPILAN